MIQKMLTISTANIDLKTEQWLQKQVTKGNNADIVVYAKEQSGYFAQVTDTVFFQEENPLPFNEAISYAAEQNCQWLMIDKDYPAIDALKKYEW